MLYLNPKTSANRYGKRYGVLENMLLEVRVSRFFGDVSDEMRSWRAPLDYGRRCYEALSARSLMPRSILRSMMNWKK